MRAGQRQEVAVEAVERLRTAKKGIDAVLERLKEEDDSVLVALRQSGDSLKLTLSEIEEEFTGPQDIQGILRRPDAVFSLMFGVQGSLGSSWGAPTEAEMIYLQQAEERLEAALAQVNKALTEDVAAFRREIEAAGLELFPALEPLSMDWKRED
jgi:hypothetical protein